MKYSAMQIFLNIFLVRWNASADSCSFLFLSLYLLAFFVLANLHMIDQTKISISGHVWGVRGCVQVNVGVHRYAQVWAGERGCVCSMLRCA